MSKKQTSGEVIASLIGVMAFVVAGYLIYKIVTWPNGWYSADTGYFLATGGALAIAIACGNSVQKAKERRERIADAIEIATATEAIKQKSESGGNT